MTIDGFLTVLTLVAAILALMTPVQRLRISLSGVGQLVLAAVAGLTILWLELWQPVLHCPASLGRFCDVIALPDDVARRDAFLIVLAWGALAYALHRLGRPRVASVPALARVALPLLDAGKYEDFLQLVLPQRPLLLTASRRRGRWQALHDWLDLFGRPPNKWLDFAGHEPPPGQKYPKRVAAAVRFIARAVPAQRLATQAADDLLHALLTSVPLLDHFVQVRPHDALPLMELGFHSGRDFTDQILTRLIATPGSLLYRELEQNQNLTYPVGYELPERNRILRFLFVDARRAERLQVWSPIGNYVSRLIEGRERTDYHAWLNGPGSGFEEVQWRDPAFCGFFYFDIMVTAGLAQGIEYHMWLPYFRSFIEGLESAYDSDKLGVDREAEFPTRAARLLSMAFDTLIGWVEGFAKVGEDSPHRVFPDRHAYPNSSIPLTASVILADALRTVLLSTSIDDRVAMSLNESVMRMISQLDVEDFEGRLRAWIIEDVAKGGNHNPGKLYKSRLREAFGRADPMLQYGLDDYAKAIGYEQQ
ncbi:hypothetical protein HL653_22125 [Sphingomonas sp. AP4-R1]|uniref:hypothetical protein n=1 Tax=Sphingomonas sp. AP4-R1 TaxID=2735134 RepID=UPI001493ADCD|nr:hypothetical protein [Sphingomonas sp. AP4-R1]QJU60072.1 hypothetical protein HL653_22125 [Sphingomonas sp. AP4-R1]